MWDKRGAAKRRHGYGGMLLTTRNVIYDWPCYPGADRPSSLELCECRDGVE